MLADMELALVEEFGEYIEWPSIKAAYYILVGAGAALREYRCVVKFKGAVRDFRFYDLDQDQPFSFIINKNSLLFYFRLPAVRSGRFQMEKLKSRFSDVKENNRGEWTVRVGDTNDAVRLVSIVFSSS